MSQIGDNVYPNTSFPNSIQTLPTFTDLSVADQTAYINYLKAILNDDYNTANTYLNSITNTALVNANKLNIIIDTIKAIQDVYSNTSTFLDVVNLKQAEWQKIINKFSYVGVWTTPTVWTSENIYSIGNIVLYNNKIWRCLTNGVTYATPPSEGQYWTQQYYKNSMVIYTDNVEGYTLLYVANVEPSNATNPYESSQWTTLTKIGDAGDNGVGFNFYSAWDSTVRYSAGELVIYNNNAYSSLQDGNENHLPSTSTTWWKKEFVTTMQQIPIQSATPTNQNQGDLWFQLI